MGFCSIFQKIVFVFIIDYSFTINMGIFISFQRIMVICQRHMQFVHLNLLDVLVFIVSMSFMQVQG